VLAALSVAAVGMTVAVPLLNNMAGLLLGGAAAASGIGLYLAITNFSGFVGPYVVGILREQTGGYSLAMAALAVGPLMSAIIILALGHRLSPRVIAAPVPAE